MADNASTKAPEQLKRTPLYDLHLDCGGRMVPFAGYSMPVQFSDGIIREHQHTREAASLFDVSHMGQLELRGPDISAALEALLPVDILDLPLHQSRYALLTSDAGGVLDDLMLTRWSETSCYLVVNADRRGHDVEYLRSRLPARVEVRERSDRALLALQGPRARQIMAQLLPEVAELHFMRALSGKIAGTECYVCCSGYTGEDGFEISVPAAEAAAIASLLLDQDGVRAAGLGARDSLRLEAGLCLYGHELSESISPVEAGLAWSISAERRSGGERCAGFPGADQILQQLTHGVARSRVGLVVEGRAPVRAGAALVNEQDVVVGEVTSGGFGPSLGKPVAMGYVASGSAAPGTRLRAQVRGQSRAVSVSALPLVRQRYFRG